MDADDLETAKKHYVDVKFGIEIGGEPSGGQWRILGDSGVFPAQKDRQNEERTRNMWAGAWKAISLMGSGRGLKRRVFQELERSAEQQRNSSFSRNFGRVILGVQKSILPIYF